MKRTVTLALNGQSVSLSIEPRETLADLVREHCGLTATHLGCEHGACGACTVDVDGKATRGCLYLAVMADGRDVTTLEGLAADPMMVVLKRRFHAHHALQCGFCTPGILMSFTDFLKRKPDPTEAEVREVLGGHICRCTGYQGLINAVMDAARRIREGKVG